MLTLNEHIGIRIADLRRDHKMTQEQLAEKLDISVKHCSHVERGVSSLSTEKMIQLSDIFDVSLDYLIRGNFSGNTTSDYICSNLPTPIISVIASRDEEEIKLLQEYLRLYIKLRERTTKETNQESK